VNVAAFRRLALRTGIVLIEDAAHAVEAVSAGAKIGATGDVTAFSFYATKNSRPAKADVDDASEEWASFARIASLHGMSRDAWSGMVRQAHHTTTS